MSSAVRSRPASSSSSSSQQLSSTRPRPASATRSASSSQSRLSGTQARPAAAAAPRRPQQRDVEGDLLAAHMHKSLHISKADKERMIESLAAEQNGYLLMLLEKEQSNEAERVRLLAAVDEVGDQRRLEKIFAIERAKAAKVIRAVTHDHERTLALKMQELGVISDDEDDEYMLTATK